MTLEIKTDGVGHVTSVRETGGPSSAVFHAHTDEDDVVIPDATTVIPGFTHTIGADQAGLWSVVASIQVYGTGGGNPYGAFFAVRVNGTKKTNRWIKFTEATDLAVAALLYTAHFDVGDVVDVVWETSGGQLSGDAKAADRDMLMTLLDPD